MGSSKKHRRKFSDADSFQYRFTPDEDESMTFGDVSVGRFDKGNARYLRDGIDYNNYDDFYVIDDTIEFSGPTKA